MPTEAEWEKAAGGTDGHIYPWTGAFDLSKCNMGETDIGGTSPVGLFVDGASPYGCLDMAGNVWEWCSTQWLDNYVEYEKRVNERPKGDARRVLRGGAFGDDRHDVRCACRVGSDPRGRDVGVGM